MNAKTIASLLALGASCSSTGSAGGAPPSQEVMMQRMQAYGTPGAAHAVLAQKVGTWDLKVRMYMSPDAPPEESAGTSTMQWILDGRFIQDTTNGVFGGQPFHGQGLLGYDNLKQAYVSSWADSMSTGIMTSEGRYDEKTQTFHITGMMPDAMVAQAYVPTRTTETWTDADHFVVRSWSPGADGTEVLGMELLYSRAR
ncbi:MAG: DUF1579 domain-containing protein [Planctomycetes bacterium]|nr:DUF1579 domain-containing protein [Planctomycetota bacterium]